VKRGIATMVTTDEVVATTNELRTARAEAEELLKVLRKIGQELKGGKLQQFTEGEVKPARGEVEALVHSLAEVDGALENGPDLAVLAESLKEARSEAEGLTAALQESSTLAAD
jgi:hypothetical protein